MNTTILASEKTLLDEFAGQALVGLCSSWYDRHRDDPETQSGHGPTLISQSAYTHAEAMLAEKARREGVSEIAPKDSDNRVIRVGWSLFSIADEALDSNDESRCFLHDWKEAVKCHREAVVQESSTTHDDWKAAELATGLQVVAHERARALDRVAELEAANRELVEALENLLAAQIDPMGIKAARACKNARAILAKHKGAK